MSSPVPTPKRAKPNRAGFLLASWMEGHIATLQMFNHTNRQAMVSDSAEWTCCFAMLIDISSPGWVNFSKSSLLNCRQGFSASWYEIPHHQSKLPIVVVLNGHMQCLFCECDPCWCRRCLMAQETRGQTLCMLLLLSTGNI